MLDQSVDLLNIGEQNNSESHKTSNILPETTDKSIAKLQKVLALYLNEHNNIDTTTANGLEFFTRFAYWQALLYKTWVEASDVLANKLTKSSNPNNDSNELTPLYIDTFEETFTSLFRSPQFAWNMGKLLNSLIEHIKTNGDMSEIVLDSLTKIQGKMEPNKEQKVNGKNVQVGGD